MNSKKQHALEQLPVVARIILWPLIAIALIHTLLIALWVAPGNPVRQEIGIDNVRSYVLPVFEQNWSIFAPTPRRVAATFEVRAMLPDSETGELRTTEWVELVEAEDAEVRHNLFPSRVSLMARRAAGRLHSARSDMNQEQLDALEANYIETPIEELRDRLLGISGGAGSSQIDDYMTADRVAVNLATGYARHAWGDDVLQVQYRTSTRRAPSYENRHVQTVDDTTPTERLYGWRAPAEVSQQELEHFGRYAHQAGASE